jgi:hypothetical protein
MSLFHCTFSIKTHVFIAEIFDRSVSDFEITEKVELVSKDHAKLI